MRNIKLAWYSSDFSPRHQDFKSVQIGKKEAKRVWDVIVSPNLFTKVTSVTPTGVVMPTGETMLGVAKL